MGSKYLQILEHLKCFYLSPIQKIKSFHLKTMFENNKGSKEITIFTKPTKTLYSVWKRHKPDISIHDLLKSRVHQGSMEQMEKFSVTK